MDRSPGTARVRLGSAGGRQRTQRCLSGFWNLRAQLSDAMGRRAGQPRERIQSRTLQELQAHGAHEAAISLRSLQCPESSEVRRSGDQPREFELRACTAVATEQRPGHSDGREINVLRNYGWARFFAQCTTRDQFFPKSQRIPFSNSLFCVRLAKTLSPWPMFM